MYEYKYSKRKERNRKRKMDTKDTCHLYVPRGQCPCYYVNIKTFVAHVIYIC